MNEDADTLAHTAPVTVTALAQVRVKYLEAVAKETTGRDPTVKIPAIKPNMRIQPVAKEGLLELARILGASTTGERYGGTVIPLPLPHQ